MIAPYSVPYGLRDFCTALRGLTEPFPDVGHEWFPVFQGLGVEVFPTHRGREGQYALLRALNLPPRASVGVPLFTHPVVWQTIAAADMQPVFLDSDPVTFGLSLPNLRKNRDRIDGLILIHTFGYPGDFDAVAAIMRDKPVLEDCAHTLGSTYRGRPLGSLGNGSFFTFLFSKPVSAGGGGCAVTRRRALGEEVEKLLREGPEETFLQGVSHASASLLFALAYRKPCYSLMTRLTHIPLYRRAARKLINRVSPLLRMRRSDWAVVASRLKAWNADSETNSEFWSEVRMHLPQGWRIPPEPQWGKWNHWVLPVCPPTEEAAARGIAKLRSHGVGVGLVYDDAPEAARTYGYRGDCREAERLSRSVFLLPSHSRLTSLERQHILRCIRLLNEITDSGYNPRRRSGGELIATAR
jgi:dTDP-4-amino-4,6-dideoxygalactose transaminase